MFSFDTPANFYCFSGEGVDKFRIKIWNEAEDVIYDNKIGESDDSYEATELGGGSIVIHKWGNSSEDLILIKS